MKVRVAVMFALFGCSNNLSGRLAAIKTGDISATPIARIAPEARDTECATVAARAAALMSGALARAPYLQRVTAHDAAVAWTSGRGASAAVVVVGTADGSSEASFAASVDTTAPLPGGAKQWTAAITGLAPDTKYCYSIYQDGEPATQPAPLHSAPAPGAGARVQIAGFGDSGGGGSDQRALLQQIASVPFDLMIHTGDIAYDEGTLGDFETKFFRVYAPLLAARPMFPASGNHDYETAGAAPFRQVFMLPENGGTAGLERWYSYDWGDVHLVALDTQFTGPEQAAWLEVDLTANRLPWTIAYGHKPPHSSGEHGGDGAFQQWFVPILEAHHVQLVLSGHDHDYERFRPIAGVTYVVTGGGGRGVRNVGAGAGSAFSEAVIHFVVITIENDTMTLHAIDATGREFDSAVVRRAS